MRQPITVSLTEQQQQYLAGILDIALKAGGLSMREAVNSIHDAMVEAVQAAHTNVVKLPAKAAAEAVADIQAT